MKEVFGEPAQVADARWRPIAGEQLARRRRGEPVTHRLLELPGVSRRSMALLGPLYGPLVDGWIWPRDPLLETARSVACTQSASYWGASLNFGTIG